MKSLYMKQVRPDSFSLSFFKRGAGTFLVLLALLGGSNRLFGQTPVPMISQPSNTYTENFADITNWTNGFAAGIGANRWKSNVAGGVAAIPDPTRITTSTATFVTGTTGGVQKITTAGSESIVLLSTGGTDNTSSAAIDLFLDFTGMNPGTLSFDAATVFNSTGNRGGTLRVYWSTDGTTFTELAGTSYGATNNVAGSASISAVALPTAFTCSATARLRFYYHNAGPNGTAPISGSRPKISIDNLSITSSVATPPVITPALTQPSCATPSGGEIDLTVTGNSPFTFNWTDITTGVEPEDRTGLVAGIYDVTVSDTYGCTNSSSAILFTPTGCMTCTDFDVDIAATNVYCTSLGEVQATATGGASPYSYTLTGPNSYNQTNNTGLFSSLAAGTYTLNVSDGASTPCTFVNSNVAILSIADDTDPVVTCPGPLAVSCTNAVPVPNAALASATDDCVPVNPTPTFLSDVITLQTCTNRYTLTRTYQAQDAAGNTGTCTQVITVNDQTAPTFNESPLPATLNIGCTDNLPIAPTLTGTDACGGGTVASVIWINEFHYDNAGTDAGEFIEIAGTAGINLSDYQLVLYNGNGNASYNTLTLSGTIDNEGSGFGAVAFTYAVNGIQNGGSGVAPEADGIALYQISTNQLIQFLSYEGTMQGANGPANGVFSTNVGVAEEPAPVAGGSIHLTGSGATAAAFTWSVTTDDSPGVLNPSQTIVALPVAIAAVFSQSEVPGTCAGSRIVTRTWTVSDACGNSTTHTQKINIGDTEAPVLTPAPANITISCSDPIPAVPNVVATDKCDPAGIINGPVWINEIHYDDAGTDMDEFIEIAGRAGTDLSGYELYLYNGSGGGTYGSMNLTGVIPNQSNGFGTVAKTYNVDGLQNGAPDGIALVKGATIIQFISYEGAFTAVGGPANGMTSTDIGVAESGTEVGLSLRLTGSGTTYAAFTWNAPSVANPATPGAINQGQTFPAGQPAVGLPVMFTTTSTTTPGCAYGQVITRTWSTQDACGNPTTHTQTITVQDQTAPVLVCQPLTVTLGVDGVATITPADISFTVQDNCSPTTALVTLPATTTFNCTQEGTIQSFVVSVRDECNNVGTCTVAVTIAAEDRCTPEVEISDPCVCKNNATTLSNGQFGETIKVLALTGQVWTVTAVNGFYATTSPAPPAAPTPITVGTTLVESPAGSGDYYLYGIHIDELGYTVTVRNQAGVTLSIGNTCEYPEAVITSDLDGPFCLYSDPVTLAGDPGDANIVSEGFTVNGTPATVFNPGAGIGQYTIVYTVNGGTPFGTDPGCIQTVTKVVNVVTTPANLACNDLVQISLDENCQTVVTPDMVLEGSYACYDDYEVKITGLLGVPNYGDIVTGANIGQTLKVTIKHLVSGNTCWGQLTVEDKLAPVATCESFDIACAETNYDPAYFAGTLGITEAYPAVVENCTNYTQSYTDVWVDLPCPTSPTNGGDITAQIIRTWIVTDASGNTGSCTQTINIIGARVYDVHFPTDKELNCAATVNTLPAATGAPYITFTYPSGDRNYNIWPESNYCELQAAYVDTKLPVCDGTYKILRNWTVYDWCVPTSPFAPLTNPQYYIQLIKVVDENGPTFVDVPGISDTPADLTVSTDAYNCCATVDLPSFVVRDGCSRINHAAAQVTVYDQYSGAVLGIYDVSAVLTTFSGNNLWNPDTLVNFGQTPCLPIGVHEVVYTLTDDCGNHTSVTIDLTVVDLTPPVAVCDEWTQVALGANGMILVNAPTFDDGSYDNCNPVEFKVRRMDTNTCDPNIDFDDQVKFCCEDLGDTITVIFRVYDIDVAAGPISNENAEPENHYNDCMVQVLVEDKLKPVCQAPANVTVTCELFDPSLWAYGAATATDNNTCCAPTISGTVNYSQFDSLCNKGTITRNWTAKDCADNTSTCVQKIVVTPNQNYYIKFPADKAVSVCDGTTTFGEPTFFGEDCELLATSFVDEIFTVVPDACFKIERTWTVINWCTYTPNTACIYVPNPDMTNGPTVSAPGNNIATWAPSNVAVNGVTTNYGNIWNANANCYKYKQIIKVIDTQDPTVLTAANDQYCDYSANDASAWNAAYWWDNPIASHNMCEGDADITITATDACSGSNISFRYLLFLDLDGDATMETVVPGSPVPQVYNEIRYNNINTPNYAGGEPRAFDFRAVPANQKWGWGMTVDAASGNNRTAHVRWVNQAGQNAVPQLPYGNHKIKWFVEDGCGNEIVSETAFTVKDCKKPTVVCINGLSINQMNGPMNTVTLWASDFLVYGEDNCTPSNLLKYGIRVSGTGSGFPMVNGIPQTSVTFGCADLGTQLVELWAVDLAGNADFCETYVIIQDNTGACTNTSGDMASVAGALKTEATQGVEDVMVQLDGSSNGIPMLGEVFTNISGDYMFSNAVPTSSNATVTPIMDSDPLNGVNTWDLVLISRHILGLEPLNSAYKLIAADANKSGTVTTFDIVELRKMILGTYTELPNNSSWRFVDNEQQFPNPENPFTEVIRENLQIANIQSDFMNGDFVGVKVGDVDGTATPNNLVSSDDRTAGTLLFDVADRKVVTGETFTVNFKAADKVAGYQFTMNFNGLEVVDVTPGVGMTTENFGIFADAVTTSADATDGEFTVTFKAKFASQLSNMLGVSSRITKAVAFDGNNKLDVAFRFNNGGVSTIAGVGFELYQNAPNPFINKTVVGFHLPEAAEATLSVYDEVGRVLYSTTGNFAKGYNAVQLDRSLLNANGVLYYKLETVANSATKKMIQTK